MLVTVPAWGCGCGFGVQGFSRALSGAGRIPWGQEGGQDRVNWVLPHSSSSQMGPMVSHPPQSLSALEWLPDEQVAPAFVHM